MRLQLDQLLTEQRNPASLDIDLKPTEEILHVINREDRKVAAAVGKVIPEIARAVDWVADALRVGGRLLYVGSGTSGRLGILDASECPPTYNVPPGMVQAIIAGGTTAIRRSVEGAEDDAEAGARAMRQKRVTTKDVIIGLAASGRTPFVLGAMRYGKQKGSRVISLACTPHSEMEKLADLAIIPLVGPEVITGSTRMKAGTAEKLVLNMISTGAMIRLGYVYSNLMIHVQSTNEKLRDRSRRIIMQAAGSDYRQAEVALRKAGGDLKVAILMSHFRETAARSRTRLNRAHGNLRLAMKEGRIGKP
jgi:N-acetylmuramic acid 6-phosphate etherase